ncbi:FecR family protein [Pedobacter sp. HDW13]|uniref:FecR family protein n=1 Tax=Pedobacter sp. HDW13 TaxID=2714940 RepID=UPI00140A55B4|nr:FecR domain-containing protein [Pedobacter sp. HDW13]QIL40363.1 FecR family protein [Pedobacter sp. HDW13]
MNNLYPFEIARLIEGHLNQKLTAEEEAKFQDLLVTDLRVKRLLDEYRNSGDLNKRLNFLDGLDLDAALLKVKHKANAAARKPAIIKLILKYAAVLILTGAGIFWYYQVNLPKQPGLSQTVLVAQDSKNKVTLTLSDGRRIDLEQQGVMVKETNGTAITINQDAITYPKNQSISPVGNNVLNVPTGKIFKVKLADGTVVWLNNQSELTFPVSFVKSHNRIVSLKGEAYFEVAHNASSPFKVRVNGTEIKVLGTRFNVNAFQQKTVSATLFEGSVKMATNGTVRLLKPGEQAIANGGDIKLNRANLEKVLSWKNGYFYFKEDGIETILAQLARWYNIKVVYAQNNNPELHYSGKISRAEKLEDVLKILADITGMKFKRNGNTLSVDN